MCSESWVHRKTSKHRNNWFFGRGPRGKCTESMGFTIRFKITKEWSSRRESRIKKPKENRKRGPVVGLCPGIKQHRRSTEGAWVPDSKRKIWGRGVPERRKPPKGNQKNPSAMH